LRGGGYRKKAVTFLKTLLRFCAPHESQPPSAQFTVKFVQGTKLEQPRGNQNADLDGADCQSDIQRNPKKDKRIRAVYHFGIYGQVRLDLICLLPNHTKNKHPHYRRTGSGNSTIGYFPN